MKDPKKVAVGKQKRKEGKDFELRVRKDLFDKGWTVTRFDNDVELSKENSEEVVGFSCGKEFIYGKIINAKTRWRFTPRGMVPLNLSPGFPDFVAFRRLLDTSGFYKLIAVECKLTGVLDKKEKDKCRWLLKNDTFSKILIAEKTKVKNKVVIIYHDFSEKYPTKQ